MAPYLVESFTDDEEVILRRYFTNLDKPVFGLVNLPEVVRGALFARYSRTQKSLRRLFLDEFVGELDISGDLSIDATVGLERAEALYDKVFLDYGDDSIAQLGGVHLACEQVSNILTKVLEWGRIMSYLEQSTRYVPYDSRQEGKYRYYRDPDILDSNLGTAYVAKMDGMFQNYSELIPKMEEFFTQSFPKKEGDSDIAYHHAIRAKALDSLRGLLPAASLSNMGIYASGQAFEQLMLRLSIHPLPEARQYGQLMLKELRKIIPSFLKRVDLEDRGVVHGNYLSDTRESMYAVTDEMFSEDEAEPAPIVRLVDFDPDGEVKMIASMLYQYLDLPEDQIERRVKAMGAEDRKAIVDSYMGNRTNRRHKPGRALERPYYRFDVLCDYGAFRDLQRHRLLTIEWQKLGVSHGYDRPEAIELARVKGDFDKGIELSQHLFYQLDEAFPQQAPYAVALAHNIRFVMQMNAREAMHLIELRTTEQGHPIYRKVAQEMHRLICEEAGHNAVGELIKFVNYSPEPPLGRLNAEKRSEEKRQKQQ